MQWNVPIATFRYHLDGKTIEVPYVSPLEYARFLLEKAPEVLFGGLNSVDGQKLLRSFWSAYRQTHPKHIVFEEHDGCTSRVLPLCVHGDEGRGLKQTNTCILTVESVFGLDTATNLEARRHYASCRCCSEKGLELQADCKSNADPAGKHRWTAFQEDNSKHHCFLTKFLVFALPHAIYKTNNLLPSLIQQISTELKQLFFEGVYARGAYWFGAVIGMKGDLSWFAHIGRLTRCYKHLAANAGCCHECCAGTYEEPFEDKI